MRRLGDVLVGLVLGVALSSGAWLVHTSAISGRLAALAARADTLAAQHAGDVARADSSRTAQAEHDAAAERASQRATTVQLGAIVKRIPAPCLTPGADPAVTIPMIPLADALAWKYAWEAERTARLHATRVLVPDLNALAATQDARIGVLSEAVALRDRKIHALEVRAKLTAPLGMGVGALLVFAVLMVAR